GAYWTSGSDCLGGGRWIGPTMGTRGRSPSAAQLKKLAELARSEISSTRIEGPRMGSARWRSRSSLEHAEEHSHVRSLSRIESLGARPAAPNIVRNPVRACHPSGRGRAASARLRAEEAGARARRLRFF